MNVIKRIVPWKVRRWLLLLVQDMLGDLPVKIIIEKIRTDQSGWHMPDENHNPNLIGSFILYPGDRMEFKDGGGTKSEHGELLMLLKVERG